MRYFPPTCSSLSPSLSLLDRFHRGNSRLALSCLVSLLSLPPPTFSIESLFYTVYVRVPSFPKLMSASWVIRERERKKEFEDDCLNLVQQIYLFPAFIIFSDIREISDKLDQTLNNRSRLRYKAWCLLRFGKGFPLGRGKSNK